VRRPGFTLIEVLVALFIFALVIVPLIQTQLLAGHAVIRIREQREALALACTKLDEVQHQTTVSGSTQTVNGYQIVVTSARMTGQSLPLNRIGVEVRMGNQTLASVASYRM
jgi:type II secretion system protein I